DFVGGIRLHRVVDRRRRKRLSQLPILLLDNLNIDGQERSLQPAPQNRFQLFAQALLSTARLFCQNRLHREPSACKFASTAVNDARSLRPSQKFGNGGRMTVSLSFPDAAIHSKQETFTIALSRLEWLPLHHFLHEVAPRGPGTRSFR